MTPVDRLQRAFKSARGLLGLLVFCLLAGRGTSQHQEYEVSDIHCTYRSSSSSSSSTISPGIVTNSPSSTSRDSISARLRKPETFKGSPLFADDRSVDPLTDEDCQIRPDPLDPNKLIYNLLVTDFNRCGVSRRNDFVHIRVWFPQFPGVVMMSDQELIIMCKPPEPTIIENKAAGFAGSFPTGARVSGTVEETPGSLEYEVALYKEAPTRIGAQNGYPPGAGIGNIPPNEMPVDQAVPIGTKLQLRARINPDSVWKYLKLVEVTVSPDPDNAHVAGSVSLVYDGCRNIEFASIIPHQPARYRERYNEVFLDFEAFLLSSMQERSTLWIHSQIKACMDPADCQPAFCRDYEKTGHGKRRRRNIGHVSTGRSVLVARRSGRTIRSVEENSNRSGNWRGLRSNNTHKSDHSAKFEENIKYSVLMPGELLERTAIDPPCGTLLAVSAGLGALLVLSACLSCYLTARLHGALARQIQNKSLDILVRERSRRRSSAGIVTEVHGGSGYTGRNTVH